LTIWPTASNKIGYWLGFWEVADLNQLPEAQRIPISHLRGATGRPFKPNFVPEGPLRLADIPADAPV
jgi:hypothetical protein